jgi:aspartyl/asparaginyl beta-hydroxylase (cupin superfamily)
MKEYKIVVFDDSKLHFAENNGNHDRIVLILDIERPSFVKKGTSDVEDTSELTQFINYMKDY